MDTHESVPVRIARAGLQWFLEKGTPPTEDCAGIATLIATIEAEGTAEERDLLEALRTRQAGVFVSYHTRATDDLRGCIGTIVSTTDTILEEICRNTVCAGCEDPRFRSVTLEELPGLRCKVDVLGDAQRISGIEELDVRRYGVIVSHNWKRGLLLPDLEGVDTPEEQVAIACAKAGIRSSEPFNMERFEVIRYE